MVTDVCERLPEFVTAPELAAVLRVSRMTIYRLCDAGDLDAIRFGRSLRITRCSIRRYLERQ